MSPCVVGNCGANPLALVLTKPYSVLLSSSNSSAFPAALTLTNLLAVKLAGVSVNPVNVLVSVTLLVNVILSASLAIVNPVYFSCMMLGAMKTLQTTLSIILGAKNSRIRTNATRKFLDHGFKNFKKYNKLLILKIIS